MAAAMALRANDSIMRSIMMGREAVVLWYSGGFEARYTTIVAGG